MHCNSSRCRFVHGGTRRHKGRGRWVRIWFWRRSDRSRTSDRSRPDPSPANHSRAFVIVWRLLRSPSLLPRHDSPGLPSTHAGTAPRAPGLCAWPLRRSQQRPLAPMIQVSQPALNPEPPALAAGLLRTTFAVTRPRRVTPGHAIHDRQLLQDHSLNQARSSRDRAHIDHRIPR